ncbi:MAG: relaxase MobL [Spiroplasma phoeniceum]|nr:MAG: relaxase MobL [Spiroplasma phoeniceum]UZQ32942.1 MAG: relaxase MobL [Spiroplasma phoeniceum]
MENKRYYKPVIARNFRIVQPGNSQIRKHYTGGNIIKYLARKSATANEFSKKLVEECIFMDEERSAVNYIGRESAATGLFGSKGLFNKDDYDNLRYDLAQTESFIWDNVWSLSTEFNDDYQVHTVDRAMEITQAVLPSFFKKYGLDPDNIEWFAAYHTNTEHAHVHFVFFEKNPRTWNNKDKKHNKFSNPFSKKMYDNFVPAYYYLKVKIDNYIRNHLKDFFWRENKLKSDLVSNKKESNGRSLVWKEAHKIYQSNSNENLNIKLHKLKEMLPKTGNTRYASLPNSIRKFIDEVIDNFINETDLKNSFDEYKQELLNLENELKQRGLDNDVKNNLANGFADKRLYDKNDGIYNRIGNQIIKFIKEQNKQNEFNSNKKSKSSLFTQQNNKWTNNFDINKKKEKSFSDLFNKLYWAIKKQIGKDLNNSLKLFNDLGKSKER